MTMFPSVEHWQLLKTARQGGGLGGLGTRERQQYHAYDYGWRRVRLNDFAHVAPIDPEGRYFDQTDARRTEEMFRAHYAPKKPGYVRDETPPPGASAEDAARFRAQWDELARLRPAAEAEHRAGIETGPALLAYGEAAFRIVRENVALWDRQRRPAETAARADELAELGRELGLRARESLPLAKAGVVSAPVDTACPWLEQGGAELDRLTEILHGKATSKGG